MLRRLSTAFALLLLFLLSASFACANSVILMNFNLLKNGQQVGDTSMTAAAETRTFRTLE